MGAIMIQLQRPRNGAVYWISRGIADEQIQYCLNSPRQQTESETQMYNDPYLEMCRFKWESRGKLTAEEKKQYEAELLEIVRKGTKELEEFQFIITLCPFIGIGTGIILWIFFI